MDEENEKNEKTLCVTVFLVSSSPCANGGESVQGHKCIICNRSFSIPEVSVDMEVSVFVIELSFLIFVKIMYICKAFNRDVPIMLV